jgi:hypothetical protein
MKQQRIDTIVWGALGAFVFALGATACKREGEESDVKSLDNFVHAPGEAETVNRCGFDYDGKPLTGSLAKRAEAITAPSTALKNVAIGVLMAVPENLARPFFAAGGKIVITADAAEKCSASLSDAERSFAGPSAPAPRACWRQEKLGASPEIVIQASEKDVQHGLLRMFAYVFSDFFAYRAAASDDPALNTPAWRQAVEGYREARNALAAIFLAEVDTPSTRTTLARLEAFRDAAGDKFAGFVAAEAVDSYYCSAAARRAFEQQFPKTYAAFTDRRDANSLARQFGALPKRP